MSIAAKLKKKAAEFEQKKQFDKALQLYIQILDESDGDDGEGDVALYNRVGDLLMRQGSVGDAMTYYEKAVDIYAESGFFNNAIALCNKILRQSPGRNSIYYKLGKISAKKGFISDAKQNFLEYASRMQGGGQLDEAFRALKEFADLCPDQDDIRLMLAEQLSKDGRKAESLEQLQLLYQRYESDGRTSEMNATLDRMRVIDPAAEPRSGGGARSMKSSELVFLDLSDDGTKPKVAGSPAAPAAVSKARAPAPSAPAAAKTAPPKAPLPKSDIAPRAGAASPPVRPAAPAEEPPTLGSSADLESAVGDRDDDLLPLPPTDDAESISGLMTNEQFAEPEFVASRKRGLEPSTLDDELTTALNDALPDLDAPLSGRQFASLHLATPLDVPIILPPEHDLALPGQLPPLSALRGQSISLTGEMDLIIPDADASGMQSAEPTMPRPPVRPPLPTRPASTTGPTVGDEPGATGRPHATNRPATAPPSGTARRRASVSDLPMLDVESSEPEIPRRPSRPAKAAADDLMLVEGAELLEVSDTPMDSSDAVDRDDVDAGLDDDWTAGADADLATPLQIIDSDPTVPEDIGGVGYENRIDLPEWMDELAAPKTHVNGSTAPHPAIPRSSGAHRRPSRSPLAHSVDGLRAQVEESPNDWSLRRALGEALLDDGDREAGLHELEATMIGFERAQDLEAARSMADEIIRLTPNSVRHHQKRVEYAFRTNDRTRLPEAYLELADALFRSGQADKARAVYHRVLELAPHDARAQAALSTFGEASPTTGSPSVERPSATAKPGRSTGGQLPGGGDAASSSSSSLAGAWPATRPVTDGPATRAARTSAPAPRSAPPEAPQERARDVPSDAPSVARSPNDSFVNLGDLLRDDDNPKSTRLIVEDEEPTGDEAADFADMLKRFKQGIAENVDDEDHQSHYDLGVAYKEMGLVDEAISEFQKALRSPDRRARTFEALGQCFVEKQQFRVAATILGRALSEPGVTDDQLVGVLYLLGYTSEALMQWEAAISYYQRVFAVDIQFRDTAQRLSALERTPR